MPHTTGKWIIAGELRNQIRDKDNHVIANIDPSHIFGTDEVHANTKLVAAAPDLLDSLSTILSSIDDQLINFRFGDELAAARAAIEKATK